MPRLVDLLRFSHRRGVKIALVVAGLVIFVVQTIKVGAAPSGDFPHHWEFGRRLVVGTPIYSHGLDVPYPPFWALVHAPLTALPPQAAHVLCQSLFLVGFVALLWSLLELTRPHWPLGREAEFWVATGAVVLASRFLIRDMIECGVNLFLVSLSWLAVVAWQRRRETLCAVLLGFATALKCTQGLFIAWFLWKRQWKTAGLAVAATLAFTFSPLPFMGAESFRETFGQWTSTVLAAAGESDPTRGILGDEQYQNIALRSTLGRLLVALPDGHPGRADHPWHVNLMDLPRPVAGSIAKGLLLGLLSLAAWRFQGNARRGEASLVWEAATVSVLLLLLSPITWGQHCVGVLPLLYLVLREAASARRIEPARLAMLVAWCAGILVLNRALLGKANTALLDSYGVTTWCLLGWLVLGLAHRSRAGETAKPSLEAGSPPHRLAA